MLKNTKIILLSSLGGALEFYDFIIYLFFTATLSKLFFPAQNHLVSLMGIFAVFALGYLIRPLGGLIFGHQGDRYGRKYSFQRTILLMAIPTVLIGFLPTYQQIGIWAPALLICLRLLQGLALGGEMTSSLLFASEHVASQRRGISCGYIFLAVNLGSMLASGLSALLNHLLTHDQLANWGWRIPFLLGGLLGLVSYYIRKKMSETPAFIQVNAQQNQLPVVQLLKEYPQQLSQSIAFACLGAVCVSVFFIFLPSYLVNILHYSASLVYLLNTANVLLLSLFVVVVGALSDNIGRKPPLWLGALLLLLLSYPLVNILSTGNWMILIMVMLLLSLLCSLVIGTYPCAIMEMFPTTVRATSLAIAFNLGFAFFGGLAPLIITYLIHHTHRVTIPAFYVMVCAVVCLFATTKLQNDKHRCSLAND